MPRLTEARRRDRYENLLRAATETFQSKGFDASSISDIAKAANVSDGLIYRYFPDKKAMLAAVLEGFLEQIISESKEAVGGCSGFGHQLEALIRTNLQVYSGSPEMCRLFIREQRDASDYRGSPLHALMREYTDLLTEILRDGMAAGEVRSDIDVRVFRDFLFGGMEHLAWNALAVRTSISFTATSKILADMIVAGVANPASAAIRRESR